MDSWVIPLPLHLYVYFHQAVQFGVVQYSTLSLVLPLSKVVFDTKRTNPYRPTFWHTSAGLPTHWYGTKRMDLDTLQFVDCKQAKAVLSVTVGLLLIYHFSTFLHFFRRECNHIYSLYVVSLSKKCLFVICRKVFGLVRSSSLGKTSRSSCSSSVTPCVVTLERNLTNEMMICAAFKRVNASCNVFVHFKYDIMSLLKINVTDKITQCSCLSLFEHIVQTEQCHCLRGYVCTDSTMFP